MASTTASTASTATTTLTSANKIYFDPSTGFMYAVDFGATSDATLKRKVGTVVNAVESVQKLNGIKYVWNEKAAAIGLTDQTVQVGVYAQEVRSVLPEAVHESKGYLSVSYDKLIPLLIEAVKELKAEIDELKRGNN